MAEQLSQLYLRCEGRNKVARHQERGEVEQINENLSRQKVKVNSEK